ncbi:hypothetical protein BX265_7392 [Streptomyces sp. TLI_235]|nr:hypothetical protein BX265_7392 [Streptomyces sp. TLI_235]
MSARKVYLLTHRHIYGTEVAPEPVEDGEPLFWDDRDETYKVLGLYPTREQAEGRIERFRTLPGFKQAPDGFIIHEYVMDQPRWSRGYSVEH